MRGSRSDAVVRSVADLITEIDALVRAEPVRWWFRGHPRASWELLPSVCRGYSPEQERYLANEFYVRARTRHQNCPGNDDYAGWLSLMQHYGLPTRLLDWSNSSLVAAFFATDFTPSPTAEPYGDACIWALAPRRLNESQGFEPVLYPLNARQLEELVRPALKGHDVGERVVAAMAVESDSRMSVQQGAFTVHTSRTPLNQLEGCGEWLRKLRIPAESIASLRRDLQLLGVRRGDLFPDLDNLARELRGRWPLKTNETA